MRPITLSARPRILVVALRRLGDVLLTTPLIRSIRRAFADASLDALVFSGTEGILSGNPDLDRVLAMPVPASRQESIAVARSVWRRYDLAISTQTGDRPALFAWAAARQRIGLVQRGPGLVKSLIYSRAVATDEGLHRVLDLLRLADALGAPRIPEVVCPAGPGREVLPGKPYAVVHAAPMFRYKRWRPGGWQAIAAALASRGLAVIASGGPAPEERDYLDEVWRSCGSAVRRLDGRLSWPELAALARGACIYIGPDTSVTHLAAASGCPTVALYGPTDPRRWGPWPAGGLVESWAAAEPVQRRGNVWLVQTPLWCAPCQQEGCERRIMSYSRCLDEMTSAQVLIAVEAALAFHAASEPGRAGSGAIERTPL